THFFFKQRTAYALDHVTGVQTCPLPISFDENDGVSIEDGAFKKPLRVGTRGGHGYFQAGKMPVNDFKRLRMLRTQSLHRTARPRSEERRVGKESRYRAFEYPQAKRQNDP